MGSRATTGLTLHAEDFQQLEYAVFLTNTLTDTKVGEPDRIRIIEFLETGLILQVPQNICSDGHPLSLKILPRSTQKTLAELIRSKDVHGIMDITGKVRKLEREGKTYDRITVEFYQINLVTWGQFKQTYSERQFKLDALVKSMRED